MDKTNIWFNNYLILFDKDELLTLIPEKDMSIGEKINVITRFTIYLAILLFVLKGNYVYFYLPVGVMVISYILYIFQINKNIEPFAGTKLRVKKKNSDIIGDNPTTSTNNPTTSTINPTTKSYEDIFKEYQNAEDNRVSKQIDGLEKRDDYFKEMCEKNPNSDFCIKNAKSLETKRQENEALRAKILCSEHADSNNSHYCKQRFVQGVVGPPDFTTFHKGLKLDCSDFDGCDIKNVKPLEKEYTNLGFTHIATETQKKYLNMEKCRNTCYPGPLGPGHPINIPKTVDDDKSTFINKKCSSPDDIDLCKECDCINEGDGYFCGKYQFDEKSNRHYTVGCDEEWNCEKCKGCELKNITKSITTQIIN